MILRWFVAVVSLFWAAVLLLVGGRFLFLLFDANRGSDIVQWTFNHSQFWVEPFFGIFNLQNEAIAKTGGAFEPASVLAFVVYFAVGSLVLGLLNAQLHWYPPRRHYVAG